MRRTLMMLVLGIVLGGCDTRLVQPSATSGDAGRDAEQLGGSYSLRFEADPAGRALPREARTRVYS